MPNKAEAQRQDREAHKTEMQAAKARRQQSNLARAAPVREENPLLLIVCQGTVTEVEYFRHFALATADIKAVGLAFDPEKLVQAALDLQAAAPPRQPYEQVWCVFDKDDTPPGNFHAAIDRATSRGLRVAYSNQAFEYWLLLHFLDHQGGGLGRAECGERLEALITAAGPGVRYDAARGKHVSRELFELLEADDPGTRPGRASRRAVAVGRARAGAGRWAADGTGPAYQESVTLVHELVEVLQRHLPER